MKTTIDGAIITEEILKEIKFVQADGIWNMDDTCTELIDVVLYGNERTYEPDKKINLIRSIRYIQDFIRVFDKSNLDNREQ